MAEILFCPIAAQPADVIQIQPEIDQAEKDPVVFVERMGKHLGQPGFGPYAGDRVCQAGCLCLPAFAAPPAQQQKKGCQQQAYGNAQAGRQRGQPGLGWRRLFRRCKQSAAPDLLRLCLLYTSRCV